MFAVKSGLHADATRISRSCLVPYLLVGVLRGGQIWGNYTEWAWSTQLGWWVEARDLDRCVVYTGDCVEHPSQGMGLRRRPTGTSRKIA